MRTVWAHTDAYRRRTAARTWVTASYLIHFSSILSSTSWFISCSPFIYGILSRLPHQRFRWIGRNALSISLLSQYNSQSTRAVAEWTAFDRRSIVRNGCDGWACETFRGSLIVNISTDEIHAVQFNVQALQCPCKKLRLEWFSVMAFGMIGGESGAARRRLSYRDAVAVSVPFVWGAAWTGMLESSSTWESILSLGTCPKSRNSQDVTQDSTIGSKKKHGSWKYLHILIRPKGLWKRLFLLRIKRLFYHSWWRFANWLVECWAVKSSRVDSQLYGLQSHSYPAPTRFSKGDSDTDENFPQVVKDVACNALLRVRQTAYRLW